MFRHLTITALLAAFGLLTVACSDNSDDPPEADDRSVLIGTAFYVDTPSVAGSFDTFDELQEFAPFEIALPTKAPGNTYLSGIRVHTPGIGDEQRQRRSTTVTLSFVTVNNRGSFHVEQVLARAEPRGVLVAVDIDGVEGQLIDYRADENRLFWHACDRAFRINYPRDVLSDEAAIDFAASLITVCQ